MLLKTPGDEDHTWLGRTEYEQVVKRDGGNSPAGQLRAVNLALKTSISEESPAKILNPCHSGSGTAGGDMKNCFSAWATGTRMARAHQDWNPSVGPSTSIDTCGPAPDTGQSLHFNSAIHKFSEMKTKGSVGSPQIEGRDNMHRITKKAEPVTANGNFENKNTILCIRQRDGKLLSLSSRTSLESPCPEVVCKLKSPIRVPITEALVNHLLRKPASNGRISDSALLWDTADCFLHIPEIKTNDVGSEYTEIRLLMLTWSHPACCLQPSPKTDCSSTHVLCLCGGPSALSVVVLWLLSQQPPSRFCLNCGFSAFSITHDPPRVSPRWEMLSPAQGQRWAATAVIASCTSQTSEPTCGIRIHRIPPNVDLESCGLLAKEALLKQTKFEVFKFISHYDKMVRNLLFNLSNWLTS